MIERDFKKYLKKLAETEFKENILAQVLALHWGSDELSTGEDKIFDDLIPFIRSHLGYTTESKQTGKTGTSTEKQTKENEKVPKEKDFRIASILLSSLRGIEDKFDNIPYGIDFMNHSKTPYSAVIVGNNGAGKTSIYSAMEYIYANSIDEAELREFHENGSADLSEYLKRANSKQDPFCQIKTVKDAAYNIEKRIYSKDFEALANPKTSFVSEYDVVEYGRKDLSGGDASFHNKVARLLGFKDYIDFYEYLNTLNSKPRKKETLAVNKNKKKQDQERKNIKFWEEEIKNKEIQLKGMSVNGIQERNQKMIEEIRERKSRTFEEISNREVLGKFQNYSQLFSRYDSLRSELQDEKVMQFLQLGLELIDKEGDCPFCRKSKSKIDEIKADANARISGFQKFMEVNKALSEAYQELFSDLDGFVSRLNENRVLIDDDLSKLSKIPGMEDLTEIENRITSHPYFNEVQDVSEELTEFENLSSYEESARKKLLHFVNKRSDFFFKNSLVTEIMELSPRRSRIIGETLSGLEKKFGVTAGIEDKESIKVEISKLKAKIKEAEKNLKELKVEEGPLKRDEEIVKKMIKENSTPLLAKIDEEIQGILKFTITPLTKTLTDALKVFLEKEKLGIHIDLEKPSHQDPKSEKKRLVIELVDSEKKRIAPKQYFNGFRYKIFCGTLAIGIAIASRKNSGINLPLILDDEFFASDIINRSEFESYFRNIVLMYRKITPGLPFQFIIFTHDELIFESARDAIENVWPDIREENSNEGNGTGLHEYWKSPLNEKTKFARLFPSSERDKEYEETVDGEKYWNLLYEFKYPQK
jgi:hypothetical protein